MRRIGAILAACLAAGCSEPGTGPIVVSAIGGPPALVNPNLTPLDPPSAYLVAATAQGLVRFDAGGQIEPALAQSWTVSDDGLSYIFRLARLNWANGQPVTAEQVAARLRAAASRASRNRLKPELGAITEIEPMTERVIEIRLSGPRPNFLQLLAQPEMAVIRNGMGTGPYRAEPATDGAIRLEPQAEEGEEPDPSALPVILRGERAALAVARFAAGLSHFTTGGTAGDLPLVRVADLAGAALRFDPVNGLFGLAYARNSGLMTEASVRRALGMAIDRPALVTALGVPGLAPRTSLLPPGVEELPQPSLPAWDALPLPERQAEARALIAAAADGEPVSLRVALPDTPGHRLLFAHLRRDWRAIGVTAERVGPEERADLKLIDEVAPALLASWYLRRFTCAESAICSEEADEHIAAARDAATLAERQARLAEADRALTELGPFIPLAAPVRWSLVAPRLTGFQPNPFAIRPPASLIARRR